MPERPLLDGQCRHGHRWHEYMLNLRPSAPEPGFWRWKCLRCGAWRNDAGRVVTP
jgi:hypothetical protein